MRTKGQPIIGYRTMTRAQRYNARMERIWNSCQEAKTRFNLSSRTERDDDGSSLEHAEGCSGDCELMPNGELACATPINEI